MTSHDRHPEMDDLPNIEMDELQNIEMDELPNIGEVLGRHRKRYCDLVREQIRRVMELDLQLPENNEHLTSNSAQYSLDSGHVTTETTAHAHSSHSEQSAIGAFENSESTSEETAYDRFVNRMAELQDIDREIAELPYFKKYPDRLKLTGGESNSIGSTSANVQEVSTNSETTGSFYQYEEQRKEHIEDYDETQLQQEQYKPKPVAHQTRDTNGHHIPQLKTVHEEQIVPNDGVYEEQQLPLDLKLYQEEVKYMSSAEEDFSDGRRANIFVEGREYSVQNNIVPLELPNNEGTVQVIAQKRDIYRYEEEIIVEHDNIEPQILIEEVNAITQDGNYEGYIEPQVVKKEQHIFIVEEPYSLHEPEEKGIGQNVIIPHIIHEEGRNAQFIVNEVHVGQFQQGQQIAGEKKAEAKLVRKEEQYQVVPKEELISWHEEAQQVDRQVLLQPQIMREEQPNVRQMPQVDMNENQYQGEMYCTAEVQQKMVEVPSVSQETTVELPLIIQKRVVKEQYIKQEIQEGRGIEFSQVQDDLIDFGPQKTEEAIKQEPSTKPKGMSSINETFGFIDQERKQFRHIDKLDQYQSPEIRASSNSSQFTLDDNKMAATIRAALNELLNVVCHTGES